MNEIQTNFIYEKPFQCQMIKVIAKSNCFLKKNINVNELLATLDKMNEFSNNVNKIKNIVC